MKIVYSVTLALLSGYIANTACADDCTPIRFNKGSYSGTVSGVAEPNDIGRANPPVCYTIAVNKGQRMNVSLLAGNNTDFSIIDEADAQTDYSFITKKKSYKILVHRRGISTMPVPFQLTVTVR